MKTTNYPPLSNGLNYFTNDQGKRICTGAQLGRSNILPENPETATPKLSLRRLLFVDGCYDQGGAYWGFPQNLYRAACYAAAGNVVEIFTRASSHEQAKEHVRELLPLARFYC
jgi:hypothetical protein